MSRSERALRVVAALVFVIACTTSLADDVPIPPSLSVEGARPVPAELVDGVRRYTRARGADFHGWHPLKREILITTRFGETLQLHRVRMPGGARTQLTFFDDTVERGISYEPKTGRCILFNKDRGGDENYQIYRLDAATGAITLITDGRSRNGLAVWANAGERIVYTSTRRTGKDSDLYLTEPLHPEKERMLAELEGAGWSPLAWSPDDTRVLVQQTTSINESALWIFEIATGKRSRIPTAKGFWAFGKFTPDEKQIITTSDAFSEFQELVRVDIATGEATRLTKHIAWNVIDLDLSPDGRIAAIITNEAGVFTLHLIDVVAGTERPHPRLPAGYVTAIHWHPNGRELGFNLDSARSPSDVYSLNVVTGKIERWTESETGGIDTSAFIEPRLIEWKSFDGRTISGFLYLPPERFGGKRPVLINIHGGPEDQFTPYFLGRWNYVLNELGIALLYPNVRGSAGFGKTFLTLDDGKNREDALRDIGALLDALPSLPRIDASRAIVTGISYGGYMTLATAAKYADRIRGAIDIVGPSNLATFLENTAAYRRDLRRVEYGDERDPAMREYLESIAPARHADRIKTPLMVVQGANDPAVPVSESERIAQLVRNNNVPVWYVLGKDEGHGFRKRTNSDYLFYLTLMFLKETTSASPPNP